jgi:cell wall-associated NlpC family hydrolase
VGEGRAGGKGRDEGELSALPDPIGRIREAAREVRRRFVPDSRIEVFEVRTRTVDGTHSVTGQTTVPAAAAALRETLADLGIPVDISLRLLPDPAVAPRSEALVRAPLAPVYRRPTMNSTQITQYVLGNRLTLLSRRGRFWRIRGEDGHVGWIHRGYLVRGERDWALAWERAEGGEPVVSLGAELHDEADRTFARLPWGARVTQVAAGRILLPDGRSGKLGGGEVVAADRLADRFPARGESITRTARRWMGAPYLWGGVTPNGVDCSGLVQSVFWIHGVAVPRDSDMQARVGAEVEPGSGFADLRPGDLLFFAERNRVNHVALSLGGPHIIHASASNGGVDLNDLSGDVEFEAHLRDVFSGARRLLPD